MENWHAFALTFVAAFVAVLVYDTVKSSLPVP